MSASFKNGQVYLSSFLLNTTESTNLNTHKRNSKGILKDLGQEYIIQVHIHIETYLYKVLYHNQHVIAKPSIESHKHITYHSAAFPSAAQMFCLLGSLNV